MSCILLSLYHSSCNQFPSPLSPPLPPLPPPPPLSLSLSLSCSLHSVLPCVVCLGSSVPSRHLRHLPPGTAGHAHIWRHRYIHILPYSGYFSRGNIFVVFVVERRTTKYLHTKKRKPRRVPRARAQNREIFFHEIAKITTFTKILPLKKYPLYGITWISTVYHHILSFPGESLHYMYMYNKDALSLRPLFYPYMYTSLLLLSFFLSFFLFFLLSFYI